jgi:isopenicillin N synthase-like dioxygenase
MKHAALPLIDFAGYGTDEASSDRIARQLDDANREFGFFYLVGHGVDLELIDQLEALARMFFAQDLEEKMRIHMSLGGLAWRGYFPVGGELTSGKPDLKEGIYFGSELSEADERVRRGLPLHGQNLFPEIADFRQLVLEYLAALTDLSQRLLAAIARGLQLPDSFFRDRYTHDPTVLFRMFNYPPQSERSEQGWGVGEHTDYGLLTLLHQDRVGGLQVRHGTEWIDVPYVPDTFVCNAGDMLERLTGGRYLSALHRARNASSEQRLSLAFFFDPGFDAKLEPIRQPQSDEVPHTDVRWDHLDPKSVEGTYGEYLLSKISKVFPELGQRVLERGSAEGRAAPGQSLPPAEDRR